jgi:iron-sulfur cluster assembly protein
MITVSDQAIGQLKQLLQQQESPDMGLRVYVTPGGCSGFNYGMGFDDAPANDDEVTEQEGIKVFVDPYSATYLDGAEIDYVDSLMGGGFTVHNPPGCQDLLLWPVVRHRRGREYRQGL